MSDAPEVSGLRRLVRKIAALPLLGPPVRGMVMLVRKMRGLETPAPVDIPRPAPRSGEMRLLAASIEGIRDEMDRLTRLHADLEARLEKHRLVNAMLMARLELDAGPGNRSPAPAQPNGASNGEAVDAPKSGMTSS